MKLVVAVAQEPSLLAYAFRLLHSSAELSSSYHAGVHGPTPAALHAYQAARQPSSAFVHAQSLQMHQDFQSGRYKPGGSPPFELTRSVELGLWSSRFEPLTGCAGGRSSSRAATAVQPAEAAANK